MKLLIFLAVLSGYVVSCSYLYRVGRKMSALTALMLTQAEIIGKLQINAIWLEDFERLDSKLENQHKLHRQLASAHDSLLDQVDSSSIQVPTPKAFTRNRNISETIHVEGIGDSDD